MKQAIYTSRNTTPTISDLTSSEYVKLEKNGCTDIISGGTHFTDVYYNDEHEYITDCLDQNSVTTMDLHIRLSSFEAYLPIRDPSNTEYQDATRNRIDTVLSALEEAKGISFDVYVYPSAYWVDGRVEQEQGILDYTRKIYEVTQQHGVELSAEIGYYPTGKFRNLDVQKCSDFVDYFITEMYGYRPDVLSTRNEFMNDLIGADKNIIAIRTYEPVNYSPLNFRTVLDGVVEVLKSSNKKYALFVYKYCSKDLYFPFDYKNDGFYTNGVHSIRV